MARFDTAHIHIIVASGNLEKSYHIKQMLLEIFQGQARISTLFDKTLIKDHDAFFIEELRCLTAETPLALAEKKAIFIAKKLGVYAIGEETLLTIPVLSDENKAFLSKISLAKDDQKGNRCDNSNHIQDILYRLSLYEDALNRAAFLSSFLSIASPEGISLGKTTSRMEGYISEEEKGKRTFEYGSIFIKHEYSKTLSELPESVILRISHRKKGLERLYNVMKQAYIFHNNIDKNNLPINRE